MEALACAKPCVASAVDGTPEVVQDGIDGILSDVKDIDALIANLRRLTDDAKLRERMGEAGRNSMQLRFSSREQMRHMHALYNRLIPDKAGNS